MINVTWNLEFSSTEWRAALFLSFSIDRSKIFLLFLYSVSYRRKSTGNENGNEQKEKRETITDSMSTTSIARDRFFYYRLFITWIGYQSRIVNAKRKGHVMHLYLYLLLQSSRKVSPRPTSCANCIAVETFYRSAIGSHYSSLSQLILFSLFRVFIV